ncbi:MAG: hypothetical protein HQ553_15520 [Chloroflexi bacterium]|nr:hypothetical protein [Chloroflexota bacterium]
MRQIANDIVPSDEEPTEHPEITIALTDSDVLEIVEGTTFSIEVLYDVTEEGYICDGPTVAHHVK